MARTCCKYFTVSLVPVAALLLALTFAFGILALPIIYTELEKKYEYGMVIDAGSSHTTIYTYKLRVRPMTGEVDEIDQFKISKSLDSFADAPAGAGNIVKDLINQSSVSLNAIKVPATLHNTTRIYLGATAGMRLLRKRNSNASEEILEAVKKVMKESRYKAKSAVIISGREEAASGWLTANALMKKSQDELVGSLDMGGGSAEIAFSVSNTSSGPHHVVEKLMNKTEHLYARSYLCYGHNEANFRYLAHLIHSQGNKTVNVSDPCLHSNTSVSHTASRIYMSSCVSGLTAQEVFGYSFSPSAKLSDSSDVSFIGTANLTQCREEIEKVFNFSACDPDVNCDDGTFEVPPVNGTLVGFSGFHYIAQQLHIDSQRFNYSHPVMDAINATCKAMFKNSTSKQSCFIGMFMGHTIEKGYGMNKASQNWTLIFESKKNQISFGWALGYFMNKTYEFSETPYHDVWPYTAVDMVVGMIILTILCAIFVIFFFLTFYACKRALKGHNGYQSIS